MTVRAYFTGARISGRGQSVALTDARYNSSSPPTAQLTITSVPTQVELVDSASHQLNSFNITAGSSLDLQALVTPALAGALVNYEIKNSGGSVVARTIGAVASDGSSKASFPRLVAGSYLLQLTVSTPCLQSAAGTTTAPVSVIDLVPPTINCPANVVQSTDPGQCSAVVNWSVLAADDSGSVNVTCTAGSTPLTPASTTGFGNPSTFTYSATFLQGVTQVHCVATDPSGNPSNCDFTVTVNDTEPPHLRGPADLVLTPDAGSCSAAVPNVLLNVTVSDNCMPAKAITLAQSPIAGTLVGLGTKTITVTATDAAGNHSSCTTTLTVNDTTPPTVSCPAGTTVSAGANGRAAVPNVVPNVMVSDNCMPAKAITLAQSPIAGTLVSLGTKTITVTATDAAGNHSSCTTTLTVKDTEPPTITCPADITAPPTGPSGAVVTFTATATDNCSVVIRSCSPASGSLFPIGTTTVTVTATDGAGNTASKTFKVTVLADIVLNGPLSDDGGLIKGSVQLLAGNPVTLNSGATIKGDLLIIGTPKLLTNGHPMLKGIIVGGGNTQPSGYPITLNGNVSLRYLRTRVDPVTMPTVAPPAPPAGTRSVTLTSPGQSPENFATIRNLTLNGNVGMVPVPPGNYGNFIANGACGFILGPTDSSNTYGFQNLTLNSSSKVQVVGPVNVFLANSLTANGYVGLTGKPTSLNLMIASGGVTLNVGCTLSGSVTAPKGTVIINANSLLVGAVKCDRLTINGNGVLQGIGN